MRLTRRTILEALIMLPIAAGTPMGRILAKVVGTTSGGDPKDQLSALMMGADLSAHGRSAGETLLKLAKIYHISASGQPFDQSVRDEITQIAKQGVATDPVAFKDLDVLLQPPSAPEQAKAWADAIGAGLQGGAALGSLMDPGASAALGVFAAIAAPGLKYLATPGLNLSERPFPPGNATPISEIAALALDKMMGVLDQNPSLAAHVNSIKADLGVDLSVSARSDELNRLPSDIRSAVATNTQMTPDQIKKAVATAVGGSLNGFVANAPQVPAAPPQPGAPPPPSPSSAEIKAQVQAAQTDVQGAITVGTFIIGRVSGDSDGAKNFGTATSAVLTAAAAFALFPASMSTLAFAGSIAGAANTIIGLFGGGGGDPLAKALTQGLAQINKQLAKMQQRLAQLEALDRQILQGITQILSALETNLALTTQKIDELKDGCAARFQRSIAECPSARREARQ